ncbi:hypothetical protein [Jannaschia sp. LMIT008]|uniref:hypothetical protein n=1 Tax=Jannaschia maritima TaxID=3032585 RepID=UPI002811D12E|nr:hypothetical protein [Jannaschia sp. LMIT008]
MSEHDTWLKKTLADILGEDRGLPDYTIQRLRGFQPEDLAELRLNERDAAMGALKRVAHQSRNTRQATKTEDGQRVPPWVDGDIDWGLRAAKSALEAIPAGERSQKANELLAACTCPAATGPNPGIDGGSHAYEDPKPALDRPDPYRPENPLPY